jgi:serine protease Do
LLSITFSKLLNNNVVITDGGVVIKMNNGLSEHSIRRKYIVARTALFVMAVTLAVSIGFIATRHSVSAQQPQAAQLPSPTDLSRTFVAVAKQVKPAVVSIDTVEKPKASARNLPEGFPRVPGFQFGNPGPRRGTGSGVIISSDGYILTNNHVAGDADQITVKLADDREFKAKRIGKDPETDLAVIKIEATGLPFARLGNSDAVEQGEWVIALGSPFGLQQTMTAGIVSAIGRDLGTRGGQFTSFIQTDASINPGNSGGPLINMQGEVVGINTLIFSETGTNAGVGFSIPSNLANKVYAQLVKSGKVTRGYLGVSLQNVTPSVARSIGFDKTEGALVADLANSTSPAAKAGLQSGDVIVEFEGQSIKSPKQLTEMVADTPVGKVVALKYVREGQIGTANVTLGERPAQNLVAEDTPEPEEGQEEENPDLNQMGIRSQTVTPDIARELKLKIRTGVIIQDVEPGSPAAQAGLQAGQVIHRVGRIAVTNRQDLLRAVSAVKGENDVVFQVEIPGQRGTQLTFITVSMDK